LGGFGGTVMIDIARIFVASPPLAYAIVFGIEAALFLAAATLAFGIIERNDRRIFEGWSRRRSDNQAPDRMLARGVDAA
jgi:hypothetical protein